MLDRLIRSDPGMPLAIVAALLALSLAAPALASAQPSAVDEYRLELPGRSGNPIGTLDASDALADAGAGRTTVQAGVVGETDPSESPLEATGRLLLDTLPALLVAALALTGLCLTSIAAARARSRPAR